MKKNLLYLLGLIIVFSSCSSAYKTSQTPDDVYYSPAKKVIVADDYQTYNSTSDDNYLRMKVRDNSRWSGLDDYNYWYDSRYYVNNYYTPYSPSISLGLGFGTFPYYSYPLYSYNSFGYSPWNSWYNPAYTVVYYKNPNVYYKPVSNYNASTYSNRTYNRQNMPLQNGRRNNVYNNSNLNANNSRNNYYNNRNNNNNNTSTPTRTYNSGGGSTSAGSRISGGGSRTRP